MHKGLSGSESNWRLTDSMRHPSFLSLLRSEYDAAKQQQDAAVHSSACHSPAIKSYVRALISLQKAGFSMDLE